MHKKLENLVEVCLHSGSRSEGILKVMDENRNFMHALMQKPETIIHLPVFAECIAGHDLFFENLLLALGRFAAPVHAPYRDWSRPFPQPWPGPDYSAALICADDGQADDETTCLRRAEQVCETLAERLNANRLLFVLLMENPDMFHAGPRSWLRENDFFFMDCWQALELPEPPEGSLRPWPLRDDHKMMLLSERRNR
jgi:hypothetical protein